MNPVAYRRSLLAFLFVSSGVFGPEVVDVERRERYPKRMSMIPASSTTPHEATLWMHTVLHSKRLRWAGTPCSELARPI